MESRTQDGGLVDLPGPALGVALPRTPALPTEGLRVDTAACSLPLPSPYTTRSPKPQFELVSPMDELQFVEQLNRGMQSLRANFIIEVESLQKLLSQRQRGQTTPARARAVSDEAFTPPRESRCFSGEVKYTSGAESSTAEEISDFSGRLGRALALIKDRPKSPVRRSRGDSITSPVPTDGAGTPKSRSRPSEPASTLPLTYLASQTMKEISTPPRLRHSWLRLSNWSDFLYADDRAARIKAKEKSITDVQRPKTEALEQPSRVYKMVESAQFELLMGILVLANSLLMGAELQYCTENRVGQPPIGFVVAMHCFTPIFMLELGLRIWAHGVVDLFCHHGLGWAWVDLVIVILAIVEAISDLLTLSGGLEGSDIGTLNQVRMARIMRVARLVRALRIQRIIRLVSPLRTLVVSILGTLKSLVWAMALLLILIYVVALIISEGCLSWYLENGTESPDDWLSRDLQDYWISLDRAMFTLYQTFTGGVSWRDVTRGLEQVSKPLLWLLTLFIGMVFFAILNVMTGVFCSNAIDTAQQNPEFVATSVISSRKAYSDNLRSLFKAVDEDHSGLITLAELERLLLDEGMRAHFAALEIDVSDAWTLFRLLDTNQSGAIEVEEFLQGCEHLKGHAKGIDLATLTFEIRNLGKKLVKMNNVTEEKIEQLRRNIGTNI